MAESDHDAEVDAETVDALLVRTKHRSSQLRGRRRLLFGGSGSVLAVALVVALAVVVLPGSSNGPAPMAQKGLVVSAQLDGAAEYSAPVAQAQPDIGSAQESAVAAAEQGFSLKLLQRLMLGRSASISNQVVSPSSLAVALSMLELGAKGQTESQIASVLGTSALAPTGQSAGWNALDGDLAKGTVTGGLQLQQANALWSAQGLRLMPAFMQSLQRDYGAGMWQADFSTAAATAAINAWAAQQTHGKITQLFPPGPLGADVALILANAIYFKGAWQTPFSATTATAPFSTASGAKVRAAYMLMGQDGADLAWANTSHYSVVALPYKGGRYSALVLMPKSGSLSSFTAGLNPAELGRVVGSMHSSLLKLSMPTFQFSTSLDLSATLKAMGMSAAFGGGADLSGLSTAPGLQVLSVIQKAFLHVDTAGTEAAAVTAIAVGTSGIVGGVPSLRVDHPFLFLIRDTHTGTILFAASVENPAA